MAGTHMGRHDRTADQIEHSRHETAHLNKEHRLTEMEAAYLTHALDAEALAIKKCMHYAEQCQEQDAKMLMLDQAAVHRRHYDQLMELLLTDGDPQKEVPRILGTT